jgi:hypothetical protein
MRVWIVAIAVAALATALPTGVLAAPTPTATSAPTGVPKASPTAAAAKPSSTAPAKPTPTPPPPTATAVPPTATAVPTSAPAVAAVAPTAAPSAVPTTKAALTAVPTTKAAPTAVPTTKVAPTAVPTTKVAPGVYHHGPGAVHGVVFYDGNADGEVAEDDAEAGADAGMEDIEVTLKAQNGAVRTTRTDPSGAFDFDGLGPGTYHISVALPTDHVGTTDAEQDVVVAPGVESADTTFGLVVPPPEVLLAMRGLAPTDEATAEPDAMAEDPSDEQVIALSAVTSLPLRFAEGRDLMAQIGRRVLGDGLVWLGVPFRTQIDGGDFQYVNCGPASLTMVLAAFGLEVGPSQVRDYLNSLIDNYNTDLGTSLDVLAHIGRDAGLTPMDLYSDQGGYRYWSTDAVRWHVEQGRPVITLVKYRDLPGHGQSRSEFDHYVVISGLTPNGFIYNDAAFASTLGYGLEISDIELQYAWENSSIPHHALALGLAPDHKALSFPEAPRRAAPPPEVEPAAARSSRRLAETDEAERAPLSLLPMPRPSGPLITTSDRWRDEIEAEPAIDDGAPMGLAMEASEQVALEPQPGPGSMVPKLLLLLGGAWLVWGVWASGGRLVRWRPGLPPLWPALIALIALLGLSPR